MNDFIPVDTFVRFSPREQEYCINLTIITDKQVEVDESFVIVLDRTPYLPEQIVIRRNRATVTITDDDSKSLCLSYCMKQGNTRRNQYSYNAMSSLQKL